MGPSMLLGLSRHSRFPVMRGDILLTQFIRRPHINVRNIQNQNTFLPWRYIAEARGLNGRSLEVWKTIISQPDSLSANSWIFILCHFFDFLLSLNCSVSVDYGFQWRSKGSKWDGIRRYDIPAGTSLVGLKSYRHFFLADCHTGMPCTKYGQLIVRKIKRKRGKEGKGSYWYFFFPVSSLGRS